MDTFPSRIDLDPDSIEDTTLPDEDDLIARVDRAQRMGRFAQRLRTEALGTLTDRETEILKARFGGRA